MLATDPFSPQFCEVLKNTQESADVFTLEVASDNKFEASFQAGQFNMLSAWGIGESAISISSSPLAPDILSHTIRAVGPVTRAICQLQPKAKIALRGPYGTGWPMDACNGKSVVLLAGGIGLAPLRPVIYHLLNQVQSIKHLTLIYGARTPDDVIFRSELNAWAKLFSVYLTVDHADTSWRNHVGVVPSLISKAINKPNDTIVMMCGPEVMMRFCLLELNQINVPSKNIFLSMERNMQCGFGQCGHCQWGPFFICKDGPVMNLETIYPFFNKKDL